MFMTVKQAAEKWGIFTGSLSLLVTKTVIFNRVIFGEKFMKKVAFFVNLHNASLLLQQQYDTRLNVRNGRNHLFCI